MPIRVAVVGSGIAAASSSYFLKQQLKDDVHIEVFERSPHIGGRTESLRVDGHNMELGAGIAYSGNKYMQKWVKEFNLEKTKPPNNKFGLWNGESFVFKESSISAFTAVKMVDRYGSDLLALRSTVYDALTKFDGIYDLQDKGERFDTAGQKILK
jgi:prenylcysteine oxidase/farnesylcysteine lyase